MVKVKDVISIMEKIAPARFALQEDRIGLQVGDEDIQVQNVLLCLDVTEKVVEEAKRKRANLIISHHPVIFTPLSQLIFTHFPGGIVKEAASHDISIYVAHTNLDVAPGGVNEALLETLGKDLPMGRAEVLQSMGESDEQLGLGKVAFLEKEKRLEEIIPLVKKRLSSRGMKVSGERGSKIDTVAFCGGRCKDLVWPAVNKGAQLFITGELGYHSALEAKYAGLSVIEAGHYETEVVVLPFLKEKLKNEFNKKGWANLQIIQSKVCTNPYLI